MKALRLSAYSFSHSLKRNSSYRSPRFSLGSLSKRTLGRDQETFSRETEAAPEEGRARWILGIVVNIPRRHAPPPAPAGENTPAVSTEKGKVTLTETRDPAPELQTQERESREQEKANDATRSHGSQHSPGAVPAPSGRAFCALAAEASRREVWRENVMPRGWGAGPNGRRP